MVRILSVSQLNLSSLGILGANRFEVSKREIFVWDEKKQNKKKPFHSEFNDLVIQIILHIVLPT